MPLIVKKPSKIFYSAFPKCCFDNKDCGCSLSTVVFTILNNLVRDYNMSEAYTKALNTPLNKCEEASTHHAFLQKLPLLLVKTHIFCKMRSGLIGKNGKGRATGKNRTRGSYNRAERWHFDKKLKTSGPRMSENHPSNSIFMSIRRLKRTNIGTTGGQTNVVPIRRVLFAYIQLMARTMGLVCMRF